MVFVVSVPYAPSISTYNAVYALYWIDDETSCLTQETTEATTAIVKRQLT